MLTPVFYDIPAILTHWTQNQIIKQENPKLHQQPPLISKPLNLTFHTPPVHKSFIHETPTNTSQIPRNQPSIIPLIPAHKPGKVKKVPHKFPNVTWLTLLKQLHHKPEVPPINHLRFKMYSIL